MRISGHERQRYDCQLVLKEVGESGQAALRAGSVLVVGAGGLGAPVLFYLAAAGIGRIGIVDDDVVELSNLQRQILFTTRDIGRSKAEAAAERLAALNPEVVMEPHMSRLMAATAAELIGRYDVIVTAVDNFPTRYLINDACVLAGKTLVDGAVLRMTGLAMTIKGGETACYRCLFPEPPPPAGVVSCSEAGVLGPIPGLIGSIQALEVIKVLTGAGQPLFNRLLQFDGAAMTFTEVEVSRAPTCPVCGESPAVTELADLAVRVEEVSGGGGAIGGDEFRRFVCRQVALLARGRGTDREPDHAFRGRVFLKLLHVSRFVVFVDERASGVGPLEDNDFSFEVRERDLFAGGTAQREILCGLADFGMNRGSEQQEKSNGCFHGGRKITGIPQRASGAKFLRAASLAHPAG